MHWSRMAYTVLYIHYPVQVSPMPACTYWQIMRSACLAPEVNLSKPIHAGGSSISASKPRPDTTKNQTHGYQWNTTRRTDVLLFKEQESLGFDTAVCLHVYFPLTYSSSVLRHLGLLDTVPFRSQIEEQNSNQLNLYRKTYPESHSTKTFIGEQ